VITVDDGYADFYDVAFPILKKMGIPATLYATAGFVDKRCWLWWDALRYLIDRLPAGVLRLDISGSASELLVSDAQSRDRVWGEIADRLVQQNNERARVIRELERSVGLALPTVPPRQYAAVTWDELATLDSCGVEIGGHTMTHAFLPGLDATDLETEVAGAKDLLESRLTRSIRTFAYPNGMPSDWSPAVEASVKQAGFEAALFAYPRPFRRRNANLNYELGRWSAEPDGRSIGHILTGASELRLRMLGSG
jgi:peptidoglycan/xylan/chitin deacetylase (PgdA/CDA1 family)